MASAKDVCEYFKALEEKVSALEARIRELEGGSRACIKENERVQIGWADGGQNRWQTLQSSPYVGVPDGGSNNAGKTWFLVRAAKATVKSQKGKKEKNRAEKR